MNIVDQSKLTKLQKLFRSYPQVIAAYFYGSRVTGHSHKKSDLDLAIVVESLEEINYGRFYNDINSIVQGVEVDVRFTMSKKNLFYNFQVLKTGRRIYEKNTKKRTTFEAGVLADYYDSQHIRDTYDSYLNQFFK